MWPGILTMLLFVAVVFGTVPVLVWLERRLSARIQLRVGPVLTGLPEWKILGPLKGLRAWGLIQTLADAVKFIFKEDFVPATADKFLYRLAPLLVFVPALLGLAAIPFAGYVAWGPIGDAAPLVIFPTEIGILFVLAATSLGVHGLTLAGWSSNNKYSQMAGVRASAQLISYEAPMFMALLAVLMQAGTTNFGTSMVVDGAVVNTGIVGNQVEHGWFIWRQPLAFVIFYICTYAETNRAPFDMPEAEPELVGGYHTEYGGMRFAMFFLGEYAAMISMCAILSLCFLGGWTLPGTDMHTWMGGWMGFFILFAKVFVLLVIMIWARWSLPRFRYDQLMTLGWKRLTPLALINLALTAIVGVWLMK